ncbi:MULTISPECIES: hypothetical protein [unclassified Pseudomonas]|uniref:hypothetical protein n=1 Tax=unclassified Pseudomonas TaxID=196821 RepID=UPI0020977745|nr:MULTISPECIES: hypothetical protein [unclassified Pseudomonas]MCO7519457.1 hypothetical protein [Pseudomonas sp. 1]MCO7541863.1 hypothetical protein [Pseudomonas sp. VA159-2]
MQDMTLADWEKMVALPKGLDQCIDEYYCDLIRTANDMLRQGLVTRVEWHRQIQQAGDWLVAAVEYEQVTGRH